MIAVVTTTYWSKYCMELPLDVVRKYKRQLLLEACSKGRSEPSCSKVTSRFLEAAQNWTLVIKELAHPLTTVIGMIAAEGCSRIRQALRACVQLPWSLPWYQIVAGPNIVFKCSGITKRMHSLASESKLFNHLD